MSDWHHFREPRSGVHGRLRRLPQPPMDGYTIYGVELAAAAEGPWIYNFDTAAKSAAEAIDKAKMRVRDRFRYARQR